MNKPNMLSPAPTTNYMESWRARAAFEWKAEQFYTNRPELIALVSEPGLLDWANEK